MSCRYGYVWCPDCGEVRERNTEIEPLPRCKNGHWMEPYLCDATGCEDEATSRERGLLFCEDHTKEAVAA